MPVYRITLSCSGIKPEDARAGAMEIADDFTHRPWHRNVRCEWDGCRLLLYAENEFDSNGRALMDEFSDAISACVKVPFDGDIEILSVISVDS